MSGKSPSHPKPRLLSACGETGPVCVGAQVRLISPATWRTVDRAQLQAHEVPTALRAVHLNTGGTGATQPFVAVGTSFSVSAPPTNFCLWQPHACCRHDAPPQLPARICHCYGMLYL